MSRGGKQRENKAFVDALRNFLGLAPLYDTRERVSGPMTVEQHCEVSMPAKARGSIGGRTTRWGRVNSGW